MTDKSQDEAFFNRVGRAITTWNILETFLYSVLEAMLPTTDKKIVSALFYSQSGFKPRLSLVSTVAKVALEEKPDLLKKWKELRSNIDELNDFRIGIVHGLALPDEESITRLAPSYKNYAKDREFNTNPTTYTIDDVAQKSMEFAFWASNLSSFAKEIKAGKVSSE